MTIFPSSQSLSSWQRPLSTLELWEKMEKEVNKRLQTLFKHSITFFTGTTFYNQPVLINSWGLLRIRKGNGKTQLASNFDLMFSSFGPQCFWFSIAFNNCHIVFKEQNSDIWFPKPSLGTTLYISFIAHQVCVGGGSGRNTIDMRVRVNITYGLWTHLCPFYAK